MNSINSDIDRFEAKFIPEPNSGCWLWESRLEAAGYARFSFLGKNRKASRVSLLLYKGRDLGDLSACHKCDVPCCVNPDHIFAGTNKDNCVDKAKKRRVPHAKLSFSQVYRIRGLHDSGVFTFAELARVFLVSQKAIGQIIRRQAYAYLD